MRGDRAKSGDVFCFVERADVGEAGDAEFDGIVDWICLELADVDASADDVFGERALEFADQFGRVVLVVDLDDDLRVVELLKLRRHREPEARSAAAFERRERVENLARAAVFVGMIFAIFFGGGFDDLLDLQGGFVGGEERDIVGQPDVEERKILDVVGEKLRFELVAEEAADDEEDEGTGEDEPAMIDRGVGRRGSRSR